MPSDPSYHRAFDAVPESSRHARAAVDQVLTEWGLAGTVPDAVLCASELVANAILHAGGEFEMVIRQRDGGVRVEVIDGCPDLIPTVTPSSGTASDITVRGATGRGLRIVESIASRWGYGLSSSSKSVWVELIPDLPPTNAPPVIEDGRHVVPDPDEVRFPLLSLPVRAAIASGVQVEDLVRDLQRFKPSAAVGDRRQLVELLRLSAPGRLLGRHAAFAAAARNETRFDVDVAMSPRVVEAFAALNELLAATASETPAVRNPWDDDIRRFREWVLEEVAHQMAGGLPRECPLPD